MILVIDNYDSFTWNLVQYLGGLGADVRVARNDTLSVDDALALAPQAIVISPGPCTPREAGISVDLIRAAAEVAPTAIPVLGVCLGHQAIGEAFGGTVVRAGRVMHGKQSSLLHDGTGLFVGVPSPFRVMRYHSLVVDGASLPEALEITAVASDDASEIHALRHRTRPVWGVQFHPESILTEHGLTIIRNFVTLAQVPHAAESAATA